MWSDGNQNVLRAWSLGALGPCQRADPRPSKVLHRNIRLETERVTDKNSHHSEMTACRGEKRLVTHMDRKDLSPRSHLWASTSGIRHHTALPKFIITAPPSQNVSAVLLPPPAVSSTIPILSLDRKERLGEMRRLSTQDHLPASINPETQRKSHSSSLTSSLQRIHDQRRNRKA